ncbi:Ornithine aminotransferase [compost metagenome]
MEATIETMLEDELPQRAEEMGEYLRGLLREQLADTPFVKEIRGKGLLIGIECAEPVGDIVLAGQKQGLLFVQAGPNVIRLLPNLYVSVDEIHQAVDILVQLIHTYANKGNGEAHS